MGRIGDVERGRRRIITEEVRDDFIVNVKTVDESKLILEILLKKPIGVIKDKPKNKIS